jgi:hypothetical protein
MNNEETKTTAEFLDESLTASDETLDVNQTDTVEIIEDSTNDEEEAFNAIKNGLDDQEFEIHLPSGTSLTMSYNDMNWEDVWMKNGKTMSDNILAIMAKARDIRKMSDNELRTKEADELIDMVKHAFEEMGVPKLDYSGFIFETKCEEALLYMEDYVRLVSELLHIAEVEVIMKPTDGMTISDLISQFSEQVDEITKH